MHSKGNVYRCEKRVTTHLGCMETFIGTVLSQEGANVLMVLFRPAMDGAAKNVIDVLRVNRQCWWSREHVFLHPTTFFFFGSIVWNSLLVIIIRLRGFFWQYLRPSLRKFRRRAPTDVPNALSPVTLFWLSFGKGGASCAEEHLHVGMFGTTLGGLNMPLCV